MLDLACISHLLSERQPSLEIEESLAESHVEMGAIDTMYDFAWTGAGREFKWAIELNPNYAPVHEYCAWYLIAVTRTSEEVAESRRAEANQYPSCYSQLLAHHVNLYPMPGGTAVHQKNASRKQPKILKQSGVQLVVGQVLSDAPSIRKICHNGQQSESCIECPRCGMELNLNLFLDTRTERGRHESD